jgi:hypothetical protein
MSVIFLPVVTSILTSVWLVSRPTENLLGKFIMMVLVVVNPSAQHYECIVFCDQMETTRLIVTYVKKLTTAVMHGSSASDPHIQ